MNEWGAEAFSYEKRRFWWSWSNVAAGGVWSLIETTDDSHHLISYHGRDVLIRVQPDLEPGRWYWWVDFASYRPPQNVAKPKPARPHVVKWGSCEQLEEARHKAFAAFVAYRHARDIVTTEQIGLGI